MEVTSNNINDNLIVEQLFLAIHPNSTSVTNAECYYKIACIFYKKHNYYDAISCFNQAITNYYRLDIVNQTVADCYYYVADCSLILAKYHDAISYYTKSIELFTRFNNYLMVCKCMDNLGTAFSKLNKFSIAISYYLDAKSIALKLQNYPLLADILYHIALCYNGRDTDKSTHYFNLARDCYKNVYNKQMVEKCNLYLTDLTS